MKRIRKISLFALFLSLVILPSYSYAEIFFEVKSTAGRLSNVGEIACATYYCITNNGLFSLIATMAIFFLGIGAFFGRIMWGTVLVTTLAVVLIVGASNIATTLVGTANKCKWAFGDDTCPMNYGIIAPDQSCVDYCQSLCNANPSAYSAPCVENCVSDGPGGC